MDNSGDAEGNYTLLARQKTPQNPSEYGLYPVGIFTPGPEQNGTNFPVSLIYFIFYEFFS